MMKFLSPTLAYCIVCTLTVSTSLAAVGTATQQSDVVEAIDPETPGAGSDWFGDGYPAFDRLVDQHTARTVRARSLNTIINHRNFEGLLQAPFKHLLGFDGGVLKIGLGLRYGIFDDWDVAVYRQNAATDPAAVWEFDTRYQFLHQNAHFIDLAVRGGFTWFEGEQVGVDQAYGGFGEVVLTRIFFDRLLVNLALQVHSHSNGYLKPANADAYSGAVLVGGEFRITDGVAWDVEVDAGVLGYYADYPIIVTGPRFITNRHTFAIVVANSQYSSADSIVVNTDTIKPNDWVFGFNITRELDF